MTAESQHNKSFLAHVGAGLLPIIERAKPELRADIGAIVADTLARPGNPRSRKATERIVRELRLSMEGNMAFVIAAGALAPHIKDPRLVTIDRQVVLGAPNFAATDRVTSRWALVSGSFPVCSSRHTQAACRQDDLGNIEPVLHTTIEGEQTSVRKARLALFAILAEIGLRPRESGAAVCYLVPKAEVTEYTPPVLVTEWKLKSN